jgi:ATP-dependent HslUV protease ATP-binding subunit HslU
MSTEGVDLVFDPTAIDKIAEIADDINKNVENTGARRLHTVLEKLLEDISFSASELTDKRVVVDANMVTEKVKPLLQTVDLRKHLL